MGKTKWKPLKLPLPRKIVHQKQRFVPRGIAEISDTTKDLKDAVGGNSHHIRSQLSYEACAERSWISENESGLSQT